jgi:flagellar motility protein MotE (MotC chaperone)
MKYILLLAIMFTNLSLFAADEIKDEIKKPEAPQKIYTKEEFTKKVEEQVEKHLTKLGRLKIIDFSKELLRKENALKLKELEFQKKEQQLTINMKHFEKKVVKFQVKQKELLGCLTGQVTDRKKRVGHMVDAISGMKPAQAAEVLSVQDAEISVEILGMLDPVKVSKIFNLMDKEISARLAKQYMNMKK